MTSPHLRPGPARRPAGALAALAAAAAGLLSPFPGRVAPAAAAPPDLRFEASLDRPAAALGERVVATYRTTPPPGWRIELEALVSPKLDDQASSGPAFDFAQPTAGAGTEKDSAGPASGGWSLSVPFTPLVPGDLAVPSPRLVLVSPDGGRTPVRPPALSLRVASRLPADQKPEELSPKADRPARIPPLGPWFWGSMAALALAAGALAAWLLMRRKRGTEEAPAVKIPAIPPGPEFLAALDGLAGRLPSGGDDPRAFYSELTRATKRYLERHLRLPVLEWTTIETVRRLREAGWEMPREIGFSELLGAADQVKFARGTATRDEATRHLARARSLYEHLERTLAAAAAASTSTSAAPPAAAAKAGAA